MAVALYVEPSPGNPGKKHGLFSRGLSLEVPGAEHGNMARRNVIAIGGSTGSIQVPKRDSLFAREIHSPGHRLGALAPVWRPKLCLYQQFGL